MSESKHTPRLNGIVLVLIRSDATVIAHAADFGPGGPAGFSQRQAQERRARDALAYAALNSYASDVLVRTVDRYSAEQLLRGLTKNGHRIETIEIGYRE